MQTKITLETIILTDSGTFLTMKATKKGIREDAWIAMVLLTRENG